MIVNTDNIHRHKEVKFIIYTTNISNKRIIIVIVNVIMFKSFKQFYQRCVYYIGLSYI